MSDNKNPRRIVGRLLAADELSMRTPIAGGADYSQSGGNYTQTSGNHNQTGDGDYTQGPRTHEK
ncbi:MAG TPA: hypothetical protein VFL14_03660 [Xanthomonadales bacterium]|nr:hypothetical protein [Xanthomonadales bacterium]